MKQLAMYIFGLALLVVVAAMMVGESGSKKAPEVGYQGSQALHQTQDDHAPAVEEGHASEAQHTQEAEEAPKPQEHAYVGPAEGPVCEGFGPQTPRDISVKAGANPRLFTLAPSSTEMNLCNIHFHTQAEHKGPGFSLFAGARKHGGYQCNETPALSEAELAPVEGACGNVRPGETIEVHWVHTSCAVTPGEGLGSCLSESCANPQLRVESQVFLVVNDENAANFDDFAYGGNVVDDLHQPKALPTGTGAPVVFGGSTTGPKYNEHVCSPLQVTWSVRPACSKVSIQSLHKWCEGNVFKEDHAHGVRQLVTSPELLSKIQ